MLTDGINLTEGSNIVNAVVVAGTSFPSSPDVGELFFRSDEPALHVYDGSTWVQVGLTSALLNGQPGSYYLALGNATGTLQISQGGTSATTAAQARINLGLQIGTNVQAQSADLLAIAALAGTTGVLKKTGAGAWALDTTSYLPSAGGTIVGQLNMTGDIVPTANITYRLGTPTLMWKDLYVGPGSIYLNGKKILQDVSNTIVFSTDPDQNLRIQTSGTGNLELQPASTGAVLIKGPMTVTSGFRITDSAGVKVEFGSPIELNGNKIIGVGTPTNASDVATKSYADSIGTIATNAAQLTSGLIPDARIASTGVTQWQTALTIAETQVTNGTLLARVADNETITGTWSFNNPITVGTPTAASHATTKSYVDALASGVNPQAAVRVATTGNITLGGLQTVDGISLIAGDRILVKDQATAALNGVYVVAAGAWTRATDFDGAPTNEVVTGDLVFVSEGSANANASFVLITEGTITVGTTGMVFSVFARAGDIIAGTGLTRTGQSIDVIGTAGRIIANADSIDLATAGTAGTYTSVTTDAFGRVTAGTNPSITLSGDISGTGTTAITTALSAVGTAGTYKSVTTDSKGRVTAGTNPTTLAGYGITDAQPLNADLTAIAAVSTTGLEVRSGAGTHTTRSIAVAGTGLSIVNADGVGGNPTITITSASTNTVSTLVARDSSGNFSAGTITAALVGNASTATSAGSSTSLVSSDTRGAATGPNFGVGARFDFKANATDGLSDGGTYHGVMSFQQYTDASGGGTRQLGFTDNDNLWLRGSGTALTSYGAWKLILNSTNFSAYAPTLTGSGASGTWAISVTGNAATVGGYAPSTTAVANTLVLRDSSNYAYFNYVNSNTANSENPTISQWIVTNGSDNFYRKASTTAAAAAMGPSITSLGTIATINGVAPPNGVIRLTPNLHLNSSAANAVILNWDNGGSGANQQVRIGNGAGVDAWYITAAGNTTQTGSATASSFVGPLTGNASTASVASLLTNNFGRTDATAYPIVWMPAAVNQPAYSCNAVTITSSTGVVNASGINAQLTGIALSTSNTWAAGVQQAFPSIGSVGGNTSASVMAYATTGSGYGAYMAFHRAGAYAINFGLDADNVIRMGGWSDGTNVYRMQIDASGNFYTRGSIQPQNSYYLRNTHSTGYLVGGYNNVGASEGKTNPIFSIGTGYLPSDTAVGSWYGIGYNNGTFAPSGASGWGLAVHQAGTAQTFIGSGIWTSGDITAYASDARLKTNVTVISNALNKVLQLRGVEYDWIENITDLGFEPTALHETGVIAQEVQAVIPDAVVTAPFNKEATNRTGVDENYLTVNKEKIIPLLIEALKELNAKVDVLQAKLAKYEA